MRDPSAFGLSFALHLLFAVVAIAVCRVTNRILDADRGRRVSFSFDRLRQFGYDFDRF